MKINLIVIKTSRPEELSKQYELLGLKFNFHKHTVGPYHYAAKLDNLTFEIYPLPKSKTETDNTTRLGFEIVGLDKITSDIKASNWKIISAPVLSEWGYTAIIEDLDGRKVELKEKEKI